MTDHDTRLASEPIPLTGRSGRVTPKSGDRRAMAILACFFAFLYAYFFQGGGWNQNCQFDSIRAIVEQGRVDITAFATNTGDVGQYQGRIYSNKLPGLAFLGAPFYWVAYHAERLAGADQNSFALINFNAHLLTFVVSAVPGVALLLILYCHFRRRGASLPEAFFLTSAFGAGSLLLPYSGVMMDHLLTACLLFGAWHLISGSDARMRDSIGGGVLAGMAGLTDPLARPALALYLVYLVLRRRHAVAGFLIGSLPLALVMLGYNYLSFGNILTNNQSIETESFKTPGYFLGVFYWPEPVRLLWLTVDPFRGVFYCCPVLTISLLSLRWPVRMREMTWESAIPQLVVAYYVLFYMCYNIWTGGWGVGPRYLIPALPFLYSFALAGYRRFRTLSHFLAGISAFFMVSASAVLVMAPAPSFGPPPPGANPILDSIEQLFRGQVSTSVQGMMDYVPAYSPHSDWDSYNLGELTGLHGAWSLIPAALAFLAFWWVGRRLIESRDPRVCE